MLDLDQSRLAQSAKVGLASADTDLKVSRYAANRPVAATALDPDQPLELTVGPFFALAELVIVYGVFDYRERSAATRFYKIVIRFYLQRLRLLGSLIHN